MSYPNILRYYGVNCDDGKSIDYIKYSDYFKGIESVFKIKKTVLVWLKSLMMKCLISYLFAGNKKKIIFMIKYLSAKFLMIDEYLDFIESLDKN